MDKRYQVFVSSTFIDLRDERHQVIEALLELDCIPAGMELFPAANDDQWTLIRRVIDDSDYYLVIIGGRYGSQGPEGLSYTEMEYRYAVESGKPVMAFLHQNPGALPANRTEESADGRAKLQAFRDLAQQRVVRYWESPADLGGHVSRSLVKLTRSNPAVGWVRADRVPGIDASQEILRLRNHVDELKRELAQAATHAPPGSSELAQGEDRFRIRYTVQAIQRPVSLVRVEAVADASWNAIFRAIGPRMLKPTSEEEMRSALETFLADRFSSANRERIEDLVEVHSTSVSDRDFQTIKIQLRALGLITRAPMTSGRNLDELAWILTPYGDSVMMRVSAIRRRARAESADATA